MFWDLEYTSNSSWLGVSSTAANTTSLPWWLLLGPAIIAVVGVVIGALITGWMQDRRTRAEHAEQRKSFWVQQKLSVSSEVLRDSWTVREKCLQKPFTKQHAEAVNDALRELKNNSALGYIIFDGDIPELLQKLHETSLRLLLARLKMEQGDVTHGYEQANINATAAGLLLRDAIRVDLKDPLPDLDALESATQESTK